MASRSYNTVSRRDEEEPMLPPSSKRGATTTTTTPPLTHRRLGRGILVTRYLLLAFLTAVTVLGWYFQNQMMDLRTALQSERDRVQTLEGRIHVHEQVIERFNSSITNADVMNRLGNLETQFTQTQNELHDELQKTQDEINAKLQDTLQELSTTVDRAEREISEEVDKVKKDYEQYVVATQDQFSMENSFMVYQLAGTFTLLSCLISMWHMTAHMRKMNEPDVQRRILAILWMSPVYAVTSWFSLVFHQAEGYLAIIKDGYEAYIIYQFLSFCIAVLGKGDRSKVVDLLAHHADHLTPPFRLFGCCEYLCGCCGRPEPYENSRALADAILLQCQLFAMQFVLFRPLTTTAMVVLGKLEYYGAGDGPTDYRSPQFYITIVQNLSIFVAFTGLLKFYHAVDKELAWCRPFAKFLCIKGVVFMTFWQGLAISILAQTTDVGGKDEEEWAKSAQNFLICLEMLLFSIAHFHCFPTEEWQEGYRVKHEQSKFGDTIALGDFFSDVKLILQSKPKRNKKRHKSPSKSSRKLAAVPEGKDDDDHDKSGEVTDSEECDDEEREDDMEEGEYQRTGSSGTGSSESVGGENQEHDSSSTNQSQYETEYSFDDSQAVNEESGTDTDEETGLLGRHFEGLSEEDRKVTKALKKSLGLAADDPDIAEAARRLLDSKILSPDFFQGEMSDDDDDEGDDVYKSSQDEEEEDDYESLADGEEDFDNSPSSVGLILPIDMVANEEDKEDQTTDGLDTGPNSPPPSAVNESDPTQIENGTNGDTDEGTATPTPASPAAETKTNTSTAGESNDGQAEEAAPLETLSLSSFNGDTGEHYSGKGTANETSETPASVSGFGARGAQTREESEGSFWAFENNVETPTRETGEPLPLPPSNEGTPLLNRSERSTSVGSSTPLHPSIFTTVAALAEQTDQEDEREKETDQEDGRRNSIH